MIFISVGSQKFQFDRIIKEIDSLVQNGVIQEEVFAQIGNCVYLPKFFKYERFLSRDEFEYYTASSTLIITHGGTGAIIGALKKGKKVIAIPRLTDYKEHVDNHQLEIVNEFSKIGLIESVIDIKDLGKVIHSIQHKEFSPYISNTINIIDSIEKFIEYNILK